MSIKVLWVDDEKTILRWYFDVRWDLDDYYHCVDKTYKLITGLEHTVHIIMHGEAMTPPTNILSGMRRVDRRIAPNQGLVVIVGADDYTRSMFETAARIAPKVMAEAHYVDTLEDVHTLLNDHTGHDAIIDSTDSTPPVEAVEDPNPIETESHADLPPATTEVNDD